MPIVIRKLFGALVATSAVVAGLAAAADADDHVLVQEQTEVVASGLDNPRHLAVDRSGTLWVAEAGRGGPNLVETALGGGPGPVCVGTTAAVSRIDDGVVTRVVSGLPSVAGAAGGACEGPGTGFGATGAHGIDIVQPGPVWTLGLGGTPDPRALLAAAVPEASDLGTVQHPSRPVFQPVDLAALEAGADFDGQGPDSNPYGLTRLSDGTLYAADAGANAVFRIDRKGNATPAAIFAPRCVPWELPFPNPVPPEFNPCGTQDLFPAQPVPTGVAESADGDLLVSTLGGFPFPVGFSVIYEVDLDHDGPAVCSLFAPVPASGCGVFADGLTALVDVATAQDGTVYAVQFADAGVLAGESGAPGSDAGSVRVLDGDSGDVVGVIEGLSLPGGVAIDGPDVYITNISVVPGAGQVVRADSGCSSRGKGTCR